MFRVLIMFVAAGSIVIAAALLIGTWAGIVIGLVLIAVGLWRTWGLIQDWRKYGSEPEQR